MEREHFDVLVIGCGISGIAAAYYLKKNNPDKSFRILERRERVWEARDFFKYPGIQVIAICIHLDTPSTMDGEKDDCTEGGYSYVSLECGSGIRFGEAHQIQHEVWPSTRSLAIERGMWIVRMANAIHARFSSCALVIINMIKVILQTLMEEKIFEVELYILKHGI